MEPEVFKDAKNSLWEFYRENTNYPASFHGNHKLLILPSVLFQNSPTKNSLGKLESGKTSILLCGPSGIGKTYRLFSYGCHNVKGEFLTYICCTPDFRRRNRGDGEGDNSFFNCFFYRFEEEFNGTPAANTKSVKEKVEKYVAFRMLFLYLLVKKKNIDQRKYMCCQTGEYNTGVVEKLYNFFTDKIDNINSLLEYLVKELRGLSIEMSFAVDEVNILHSRNDDDRVFGKITREMGHNPLISDSETKSIFHPFVFYFEETAKRFSSLVFYSGTLLSQETIGNLMSGTMKSFGEITLDHEFERNEDVESVKEYLKHFLTIEDEVFSGSDVKNFLKLLVGRKRLAAKVIQNIPEDVKRMGREENFENACKISMKKKILKESCRRAIECFKKRTKERIKKYARPETRAFICAFGCCFRSFRKKESTNNSNEKRGFIYKVTLNHNYVLLPAGLCYLEEYVMREEENGDNRLKMSGSFTWLFDEPIVHALLGEGKGFGQVARENINDTALKFIISMLDPTEQGSKGRKFEEFFVDKFTKKHQKKSFLDIFESDLFEWSGEEFVSIKKDSCAALEGVYLMQRPSGFWEDLKNSGEDVKYHNNVDTAIKNGMKHEDDFHKYPLGRIFSLSENNSDDGTGHFMGKNNDGEVRVVRLSFGNKVLGTKVENSAAKKNVKQTSISQSYSKKGETGLLRKAYDAQLDLLNSYDVHVRVHVEIPRDGRYSDFTENELYLTKNSEDLRPKSGFCELFVWINNSNFVKYVGEEYQYILDVLKHFSENSHEMFSRFAEMASDSMKRTSTNEKPSAPMRIKKELSPFKIKVFFNRNSDLKHKLVEIDRNTSGSIVEYFFKECAFLKMKDEGTEEEDNDWDGYTIWTESLSSPITSFKDENMQSGSVVYFLTEKERKEEEEARKLKEEEEARKLKEEEEARKLKLKEDEEKLRNAGYVTLYYMNNDLCKYLDVKIRENEKYDTLSIGQAIEKFKEEDSFEKNGPYSGLWIFRLTIGKGGRNVVGEKMRVFEKCVDLVGKIVFLLTDQEKKDINESRINFKAGSGMSFLDKWFDDDDEEKGTGAISVDKMKDEESGWNKEILLECCDGGILRKNMDDLLRRCRFFRMMMSFNGKEAHEAREDGKIKIEFLSSLELKYYLNVVFGVQEEVFLDEIGGMRLLLRLLEFGVRYQERKLTQKILTDLETVVIPDLVSCGHLELKLLETGYLLYDRLPNNLLEELLDRWCSMLPVVQTTASMMMRYVKYSSNVMEKAHTLTHTFLEEEGGGKDILLDGCLKDSTLEQTLIKTKRRREEEDSQVENCVGGGKMRKLMNFDELKSFLMK